MKLYRTSGLIVGGRQLGRSGNGHISTGRKLNGTPRRGRNSQAVAPYSQAQGWQAVAMRPGESAMAGGAFAKAGDAQSSVLVARALTVDATPVPLLLAGTADFHLPSGVTVAVRILVAARSEGGRQQAAFEWSGMVSRQGDGVVVSGATPVALHRSSPGLALAVDGGPALRLKASGLAGVPIRWVARIELAEVQF